MSNATNTRRAAEDKVREAGEHLYMALHGRFGPVDFAANDPLVKAIVEYGQACRTHDAGEDIHEAAEHVYMALRGRFGPVDFAADSPLVRAIVEYGHAHREAAHAT